MTLTNFLKYPDPYNAILACSDSELKDISLEALKLVQFDPHILELISRDIDLDAKNKKSDRIEEKRWYQQLTYQLPGLDFVRDDRPCAEDLELYDGRPRKMDSESTFLLMMVRAYLNSVTSKSAADRIRDSVLVNTYFEHRGMEVPSSNTILDHINAVSHETREYIFEVQMRKIMSDGWDPMNIVAVDSFSVSANTDWPTDSRIMLGLLQRAYRRGRNLVKANLPGFEENRIVGWLKRLKGIDFKLACTCGKPKSKGKIKKLYRRFLEIVDKTVVLLIRQFTEKLPEWNRLKLSPSRRRILDRIIEGITKDIEGVIRVYRYASDRVFEGISLPAPEKILSLSDECASFIKKGDRNPVIGYKPQISRSGEGFITAYEIMEGNPKDSTRLEPMIDLHMSKTQSIPGTITVDDGYSSETVRIKLLRLGIKTVSINGSKGKKITSIEEWESVSYQSARNARSAVESMIFTLRYKFHLYRFCRRGIDRVSAELIEKIIAYNLWRTAYLKKRPAQKKAA